MKTTLKILQSVIVLSLASSSFIPNATSVPRLEKSVVVEGLKYELQQCIRVGQKVKCNALVTSTERDIECYLFANQQRAFDFTGNQHFAESVQFSNLSGQVTKVGLIQGVPVKASILFNNMQQINKLAVLEAVVGGGWSPCKPHVFQFRNITINSR